MTLGDSSARDGLPPRGRRPELLIEPLGYPQRCGGPASSPNGPALREGRS
jgi:hypothetical protein